MKQSNQSTLSPSAFIGVLLELQENALAEIKNSTETAEDLRVSIFGNRGEFAKLSRRIREIPAADRAKVGVVLNQVKQSIEVALTKIAPSQTSEKRAFLDVTAPGKQPPVGHLHIVTQAIADIVRIFERIGFNRVRHPEVDWDWYPFESLNMPPEHPARDEWETFFIRSSGMRSKDPKKQGMVLTPHTSNGQVREMEKGKLPIRMINIAKCYRRQVDVSHTPMFHQFEGLYIDRDVSIAHLKGIFDYFASQYYSTERMTRLRQFHFQFTEPSFEVDITCGVCLGKRKLPNGTLCRLCKAGWLELGGAGMVHPVVLRNGGIDPNRWNGFAFGWGVERVAMMKSGTNLDDIRLLYGNDTRFLEQF